MENVWKLFNSPCDKDRLFGFYFVGKDIFYYCMTVRCQSPSKFEKMRVSRIEDSGVYSHTVLITSSSFSRTHALRLL